MRTPHLLLAVAFQALSGSSQTITHITQLSVFSDLPLCISTAVDRAYESFRTSDCPQTNPTSAASCMCLKSGNPASVSRVVTRLLPVWCGGLGFQGPEYQETVSSGVSLFSEFCTQALGAAAVAAALTAVETTPASTGNGPVQTSAGMTTSASLSKPTSTTPNTSSISNTPTTSSDSPTTSSASSSGGLSLGEKLAIGISIPATLSAMLGCWFAYKQYQTSQKKAAVKKEALRLSQFNPGPPSSQNATRSGR
ncbi:hypothetical protein BKA61DRAFT_669969 [Leptodontidium sp. MPI-SDFR-AT-0119]|nr:hypothetical protein BKA61DRAFT_669969 [Leptodontidium sp. MPI-SDFR-AT-0119]